MKAVSAIRHRGKEKIVSVERSCVFEGKHEQFVRAY